MDERGRARSRRPFHSLNPHSLNPETFPGGHCTFVRVRFTKGVASGHDGNLIDASGKWGSPSTEAGFTAGGMAQEPQGGGRGSGGGGIGWAAWVLTARLGLKPKEQLQRREFEHMQGGWPNPGRRYGLTKGSWALHPFQAHPKWFSVEWENACGCRF